MKTLFSALFAALGLVLVLSISGVLFIMDETEQAIITRFGKPVRKPIRDPGLYAKLPIFVEDVNRFEKRWLSWDGDPNMVPTKDKKYIWLDTESGLSTIEE